ncbi:MULTISPECIES: hypothetical protein [Sphingobium]|uniref:hypothetical protein n=1 Tax=Sphingobium sp. TaxID=1912891 RepID=UPI00257FAA99|nr:hypothetical protein [Sphingobium sp.]MBR2270166.1 hypothetical protein [Sphingobium sp.]
MSEDTSAPYGWAACYAQYRGLLILRDADVAFGAVAEAKYEHEMAVQRAEAQCGSRQEVLAQREVKVAQRAMIAAEDHHHATYGEPLEAAAIAAVLVPAPDLAAVELKMGLIRAFELDNRVDMPRRPMEIIEQDVAALSGIPDCRDQYPAIAVDQAAAHLINADQLAETIAPLINPDRHTATGLRQAMTLLGILMDEQRRAAEALGGAL